MLGRATAVETSSEPTARRVLKQSGGEPVFQACPLCGAERYDLVFEHPDCGTVVSCRGCRLRYTKHRELASWPECRRDHPGPLPEMLLAKEADQAADFSDILDRLRAMGAHGRMLEIGSITGHFLDRARSEGFDTVGIEPDPWTADYARQTFGLDVREDYLPDAGFADGSFDVVVMLHVMEHLVEPKKTLREIHRVLSDRGVLVVEIPIVDNLAVRAMGPRHRHYVFDHTMFMTRRTCSRFLREADFDIVGRQITGRSIRLGRLAGMVERVVPVGGSAVARTIEKAHLDERIIHVSLRDVLRTYAVKA